MGEQAFINARSRSIERHFDAGASQYHAGARVQAQVAELVVKWISDWAKNSRCDFRELLEVGCGTGILTERLLAAFPDVTVIASDVSQGMLSVARERLGGERIQWLHAAVEALEVAAVDAIASASALHWCQSLDVALGRLRELLKPKGNLFVALMLDGTLGELHEVRQVVAPSKAPLRSLPTRAEFQSALSRQGFSLVNSEIVFLDEEFPSAEDALRTLKRRGLTGGAVSMGDAPLSRSELQELCRRYNHHFPTPRGGVRASYVCGLFHAAAVA